ncbi:MAG TPA: hypothetical protein VJ455_00290 [Ignavibacteria bacterium]|nr:hypothetical protein [Ignavibacteria bacterium]
MTTDTKCKCGNTKGDPMIMAKTRYTKGGYFLLSLGFSAKPTEVVFQCQNCGEVIDVTSDEDEIEKYRYNSDVIQ